MRRPWWAGLALILALGLWLRPYALALYHLEVGGRALDQALAVEGHDTTGGSRPLLWEPLTTEEAQALAEQAAGRFQAAVAADRRNAQACRWPGRASLLPDEPGEAAGGVSKKRKGMALP